MHAFIMSEEYCEKEVLVVFQSRRRPVKFKYPSASPSASYRSLFSAIEGAFRDILTAEEGSSTSESGFFLQVESSEWGGFIDVTPETPVDDHATVYLCKPSSLAQGHSTNNGHPTRNRATSSEQVQCCYVYLISPTLSFSFVCIQASTQLYS